MTNTAPIPDGWFTPEQGAIYQREVARFRRGLIVEVGTWLGRSTSYIAPLCAELDHRLCCVDTWRGSADGTAETATVRDIYGEFESNMRHLGVWSTIVPMREASVIAATSFADRSVDLVMIDADHAYESVAADILAWRPKLKHGGTLMGHDFDPVNWPGVVRAVTDVWPRVSHEHRVWIVRGASRT